MKRRRRDKLQQQAQPPRPNRATAHPADRASRIRATSDPATLMNKQINLIINRQGELPLFQFQEAHHHPA
jgi:hypothetical protein